MQYFDHPLPLAFLKADRNGEILSYSTLARENFELSEGNLKGILDEESVIKLLQYSWVPEFDSVRLELNMKTKNEPIALFEVHILWDSNDHANMIFLPKDSSNEGLLQKLMEMQKRLASTDFELLEKKEELEQVLIRLNELSGPFIPLSETMCLIPIFGDITEEKMNIISESCLKAVFTVEYEEILFDLTAVGKIEARGIEKFTQLMKTLNFMTGSVIKLIGIKPNLAKMLNKYKLDEWVQTDQSLKQVLSKYLIR
ncbi:Stressosome protein rsbRB [Bacillus sp. SA1-12]|uniref:STAS domain-containing protein n=1 Tax=Bacillus sp. SA1-12 TaxID=1455638 RepID=UPI000626F3B6|nr:STAS domain-containing protein [Bacillus sp. SA1-12]KKI88910.1 Stressosome protein rsbRB [Bacillus sp. SA1-12]